MNEAQAVTAIHAFFATGWAAATPVFHDDEDKALPSDSAFISINVRHASGDQTTMGAPGNNRHEQEGGITIQVFTPQGNTAVNCRTFATAAAAIFRGKETQGIRFYQTSVGQGRNDGRGYYQINVNIRFKHDIFA